MMERQKAYEEKIKALVGSLSGQAEALQVRVLKADAQTRFRLGPTVEGLGGKLRELRSLVRELPLVVDDDFKPCIGRIEGVLLDVLILLNIVMADLLNIPGR
jgi:hypothetical protein